MDMQGALQKMLSGDSRACKRVAEFCHQMASAYLKYKLNHSKRQLLQQHLDRDELAWDCIAGLFEREDNGQYVIFQDYLEDYELDQLAEDEVRMLLRRLVFTKVNDGLFRNFGRFDPSLRKIIRNVKRAVKDMDELEIRSRGSQKIVAAGPENSCKPMMPPEVLEARLFPRMEAQMRMPEMMEQFREVLVQQQLYRSSVVLTQLAVCLRKVYARMNNFAEENTGEPNPRLPFWEEEVRQQLQQALETKKQELTSTYLDSGKLDESLFDTYFAAVRDILEDEYIERNPAADSYFEHLKVRLPELDKQTYRSQHRQYLEYIVQKTRDELVGALKNDLFSSAESSN